MEKDSFRQEVNSLLEAPCANTLETKSVLQILVEDIGVQEIQEAVHKPLKGLKVVPYYGCIMNRPPEIMDFDDPENPVAMDRVLSALGATVLDFPLKVECCGGSYGVARKDIVVNLSGKLLRLARDLGAHAVVTACPLCQMNLDLRQAQINTALQEAFQLPIFYYTQLMGLAMGKSREEMLLKKLVINPRMVLDKIEETQEAAG
jgi:heterodisulfide reductase subunit B